MASVASINEDNLGRLVLTDGNGVNIKGILNVDIPGIDNRWGGLKFGWVHFTELERYGNVPALYQNTTHISGVCFFDKQVVPFSDNNEINLFCKYDSDKSGSFVNSRVDDMEKQIYLKENIKDNNGNVIATMATTLNGDGATPSIVTLGGEGSIIGYSDDGRAIVERADDQLIKAKRQEFMSKAIEEQKKLCIENGVDPELVNIINAERRAN